MQPHSYCLIPVSFLPGQSTVSGGDAGADADADISASASAGAGAGVEHAAVLRVWSAAARPEEQAEVTAKGVRCNVLAMLVGRAQL